MAKTLPAQFVLDKQQFSTTEPVSFRFILTNPTDHPIYVCRYHTPLERLKYSHVYKISRNGTTLQYRGIMCKRSAPQTNDYLLIEPGNSLERTINYLGEVSYDLSQTGTYKLGLGDFDFCVRTVQDDADSEVYYEADCQPVEFQIQ